jgi:hypothetical protein
MLHLVTGPNRQSSVYKFELAMSASSTYQLTSGIENIRLRWDGEDPLVSTLFVIEPLK